MLVTSQLRPPTGDRPRQDENRHQRSDHAVQQHLERPLIRGHFGLIRPRTAVATYVISSQQSATINEQYRGVVIIRLLHCSAAIAAAAAAAAGNAGDANVFAWMLRTTATSGDRCSQLNTQP